MGFLNIDRLSVLASIQFGLKCVFFRFYYNSDLVDMLVLDFKPTDTTVFCLDNLLYNKSLPVCIHLFTSSPVDFRNINCLLKYSWSVLGCSFSSSDFNSDLVNVG